MSEQVLDVQSVFSVVRRRRWLLAALSLVGALAGATTVVANPPQYESATQVLLPAPTPNGSGAQERDTATDLGVVMSDVVLGPAGSRFFPTLSTEQMRKRIHVTAPSGTLLRITASASTAHSAELLTTAVAQQEVAYQEEAASSITAAQQEALKARSETLDANLATVANEIRTTKIRLRSEFTGTEQWRADSTVLSELTAEQAKLALQIDALRERTTASGKVGSSASIVDTATPAKRGSWWVRGVILSVLGALLAFLVSAITVVAISRRDRRLRTRDEVADALGSAVIGSLRARPQRAAAGWASLLETYQPTVTDAWSLRQVLDHVGLGDSMARSGYRDGVPTRTRALTLITLSNDVRGLAVGPQLASHAAALGLRTRLIAEQGHESSAALWAACSALRGDAQIRPGLKVDTRRRKANDDLVVKLVVVDRDNPQFVGLESQAVTLLAVSASSATAEDLARTAVAAYAAGGRISGLIVADPDSLDRTTGRLLLQQRAEQASLPTRMTGLDAYGPTQRRTGQ